MQVGINDDNQDVCSMDGCPDMDPLAARCTNCHKIFCARHISSSAHSCTSVANALVATCPICNRVVSMEFPGQPPDEAVSRHIDRGCRDVPHSSPGSGATSASQAGLQWQQNPGAGTGHRLGGGSSSQRPANGLNGVWCAVPGCDNAHSKAKQVICDRCGRGFCIEHRSPAQHHCGGRPDTKTTSATTRQSASRTSPPPSRAVTDFATLLRRPSNTHKTALGKATEREEDMVVPLVCIAVPVGSAGSPVSSTTGSATLALAPVPPFFLHAPKSYALGRVLDNAVSEASRTHAAVRVSPPSPWQMHVVGLPVPLGAVGSPGVYPPMPLSTLVRNSPLATTRNAVVVISPFPQLPKELLQTIAEAWPTATLVSGKDKDTCLAM